MRLANSSAMPANSSFVIAPVEGGKKKDNYNKKKQMIQVPLRNGRETDSY